MKIYKYNENCFKRGIDWGFFYEMLVKIEKDMVDLVEFMQYRVVKSSIKYCVLYKFIGREVVDLEVDVKNELMGLLNSGEFIEIVMLDFFNVQYILYLFKEVL